MRRIWICAATAIEAKACEKGIARAAEDTRDRVRFEVVRTGMGLENAHRLLRAKVATTLRTDIPVMIVSTGFAGGWGGGLRVGDWAYDGHRGSIASDRPQAGRVHHLADVGYAGAFQAGGPALSGVEGAVAAECVSVERLLVHAPQDWTTYAVRAGAAPVCVDMESHAWARVSQEFGIPFGVLRLISDTPTQPFPAFIGDLTNAIVEPKLARKLGFGLQALRDLARHPRALPDFIRGGGAWSQRLDDGWARWARALAT